MLDNPLTRKLFALGIVGTVVVAMFIFLNVYVPTQLPEQVESAMVFIFEELWKWDFMLPVQTLLNIMIFSLLLETGIFTLNIFLMIWRWLKLSQ